MFHSKHPAALLHATARIVSGSGVYVSDKPGAHDFELLRRMVLPDGSVLRPLLPGRPTKDILFADVLKDNKTLLKVFMAVISQVCLCCYVKLAQLPIHTHRDTGWPTRLIQSSLCNSYSGQ